MDDPQTIMALAMNALKEGNRTTARELLLKVLEHNEHNEEAWLWLAGAIEDPQEQRIALENVLFINPANTRARQGLDWLRTQHPQAFVDAAPPLMPPAVTGATIALAQPAAATGATIALPAAQHSLADLAALPLGQAMAAYTVPDAAGMTLGGQASDSAPACPRCGTPVPLQQTRCARCSMLQIEKIPNPNARTAPLKVAGILGIIYSTLIYIVPGLLFLVLLNSGMSVAKKQALLSYKPDTDAYAAAGANFDAVMDPLIRPAYNVLLGLTLVGVLGVVIAIWMMKRNLVAYILAWLFFGLNAVVVVLATLFQAINGLSISSLADTLEGAGGSTSSISTLRAASAGVQIVMVLILVLIVLCLALGISVFRKKTLRMALKVSTSGDADEHFNLGLRYQRHNLWYQAMREWETAVEINANDSGYHHALGLAYAKLNRPDMGLRSLDAALRIAPDDPQLHEDRHKLAAALAPGVRG